MRANISPAIRILAFALAASHGAAAHAVEDDDDRFWSEEQVAPPAFPKESDLLEVHVGTGTTNRFFVDGSTLAPGRDGVVRYVLVVKTGGGATNITFEGVRCKTGEYRVLAIARPDGTWASARMSGWRRIEDKFANRHHAVLGRELFCPFTQPIRSADEGRDALRRGKHPSLP